MGEGAHFGEAFLDMMCPLITSPEVINDNLLQKKKKKKKTKDTVFLGKYTHAHTYTMCTVLNCFFSFFFS